MIPSETFLFGPLGPSGVIPIEIPFFAILTNPRIPPTAFLFVDPQTVRKPSLFIAAAINFPSE